MSDANFDRPQVERPPLEASGDRSTPPDGDLAAEVAALAGLLAEVVALATERAVLPGRWAAIAEVALEHDSVRRALSGAGSSPAGAAGQGVVSVSARRCYDRWRDVDGAAIAVGVRVEQTEVDARMGALRARLHQRGEVISRGTTRLVVRFDGEDQTVRIRPHLVRVLQLDTKHIVTALEQVRELIPGLGQR